jgi:hypothetical protein
MWVEQGVGESEATDLALRNCSPPEQGGEQFRLLFIEEKII